MNYQAGAATTIDKNSRYQPLDKDKRLVRFLRMLHDERSSIACELAVFSLDDQPEHLALSYCWTKADPIYEVQLNGRPFYVRPNLYAYLELMRSEQQSGWIFIDALCINQSDIEERSSQVALMVDVYREAVGVVVWLGVRRWGKRKGSEGDGNRGEFDAATVGLRCNNGCDTRRYSERNPGSLIGCFLDGFCKMRVLVSRLDCARAPFDTAFEIPIQNAGRRNGLVQRN